MAERQVTSFTPTKQMIEDMQRAYDGIKFVEDMNRRFRAAGEPRLESEAKSAELRTRIERRAASFDVPLE